MQSDELSEQLRIALVDATMWVARSPDALPSRTSAGALMIVYYQSHGTVRVGPFGYG